MVWDKYIAQLDRLFTVSEAWLSQAIPLLHTLESAFSKAVVTQSMRWLRLRLLRQSYSVTPHQLEVTVFFSSTRQPLAEHSALTHLARRRFSRIQNAFRLV